MIYLLEECYLLECDNNSFVDVYGRFEGTYCLRLQGRREGKQSEFVEEVTSH
jgi:hypothetical protein